MRMNLGVELRMLAESLWVQFVQIAPYWALGLIMGSLVSVYLSERIVARVSALGNERFSFAAVCVASALGIASPLCMYGTVPLVASLGRKRVPSYILAAFMMSSIFLNPNLFLMSFALGVPVAMARLITCTLGGIVAGVVVWLVWKDKSPFRFDSFEGEYLKKKRTLLRDLLRAFQVTAPYFFFGVLLTALYDRYFPREWMSALFGGNQAMGTLFAASLSIPLYACGGGAIPLMLAWMREGMSAGAAVAFMLAGPATKFTNLGAVKIILGAKNFALYLAFSLVYAVVCGILTDMIFAIGG
jgi:uncharacterized membrane protein YraQ (UPF0718 family)